MQALVSDIGLHGALPLGAGSGQGGNVPGGMSSEPALVYAGKTQALRLLRLSRLGRYSAPFPVRAVA
jgi:hypothetical protein